MAFFSIISSCSFSLMGNNWIPIDVHKPVSYLKHPCVLGHYEHSYIMLIRRHKRITAIKGENTRFPELLEYASL